jgi:6,7-dimethyl-8-ribityllumazine synthase
LSEETDMSRVYEGSISGAGKKFGIVVSRFNEFISLRLLEGAMDCLRRHGAADDDISIAWVPGAFDVPAVAKRMGDSGRYDALVCLGAVIRGATPHFDYVASEVAKGVAQVSVSTGVPTVFGVVTADSLEQAIERAGSKAGNRGWDAAESAMELAGLYAALE